MKMFALLLTNLISLNTFAVTGDDSQKDFCSTALSNDGERRPDLATLMKFAFQKPFVGYVKFTVLLDESKKPAEILFQNSTDFPFHSDFLLTRPEFKGMDRRQIDELTLKRGPNQRAIL